MGASLHAPPIRELPIVRWAQSERTAQKRSVVELEREPKLEALRARFVERGVWVRPFGNIVYLMPPLVIGAEDLGRLTAAVHAVIGEAAAAGEPLARAAYSRSAIATWPHTDKTRNGGGFGGLVPTFEARVALASYQRI